MKYDHIVVLMVISNNPVNIVLSTSSPCFLVYLSSLFLFIFWYLCFIETFIYNIHHIHIHV